jgi:hypothetical protein
VELGCRSVRYLVLGCVVTSDVVLAVLRDAAWPGSVVEPRGRDVGSSLGSRLGRPRCW